jgi:mannose-6-phosphate isomerase-like protein (cupin superfamily)
MRVIRFNDSDKGVFKGGRIILYPGEEVGEHVTENREEVIIVLRGEATIMKEGEKTLLKEKDVHFIGNGIVHNVKNETKKELEYIYVVNTLEKRF